MKNSALVVVDMLYDFIDGSLACSNAENAVSRTVEYIDSQTKGQGGEDHEILDTFPILFIRDHHPADHSSFKEYGGIWPSHCVAGTRGGEIHEALAQTHVHQVGGAIQPSHPLSSPSPPAFNLSQHQGYFQ